jgi:transcriptional regulator
MYMPAYSEESRPERLHALIAQHFFGMLVTKGPGGLDANHLPFEFEAGTRDVLGAAHALEAEGHHAVGDAMLAHLAERSSDPSS